MIGSQCSQQHGQSSRPAISSTIKTPQQSETYCSIILIFFLSFFFSSLYSISVLSNKKNNPHYRGIVIYPLQPTKVNFKVRPGYFPSIYFCAVDFRLSEAEQYCTTVPSVSVTFQIFFSTMRGSESRKPFTEVDFWIPYIFYSLSFFLSFSTLYIDILHSKLYLSRKKTSRLQNHQRHIPYRQLRSIHHHP